MAPAAADSSIYIPYSSTMTIHSNTLEMYLLSITIRSIAPIANRNAMNALLIRYYLSQVNKKEQQVQKSRRSLKIKNLIVRVIEVLQLIVQEVVGSQGASSRRTSFFYLPISFRNPTPYKYPSGNRAPTDHGYSSLSHH